MPAVKKAVLAVAITDDEAKLIERNTNKKERKFMALIKIILGSPALFYPQKDPVKFMNLGLIHAENTMH